MGPTHPPVQWVFPGGKERPGRDADPSLPSSAVVMKELSYTSTSPMGRTACTESQSMYKGAVYLYLVLVAVIRFCGSFTALCVEKCS